MRLRPLSGLAILLAVFVTSSLGATTAGFFRSSRYPGKCTIRENLILSPGDMVKDPNQDCGRILCGGKGYAEFHSCNAGEIRGCTMGDFVDKNLPYPHCCKRLVVCEQK